MQFNSVDFGLLLVGTWLAFHTLRTGGPRLAFLILASLIFYGAWDHRFLVLIFISAVVDFTAGGRIAGTDDAAARKRWLTLSLLANLGILGYFKYANFFIDSVTALFGSGSATPYLEVLLPPGISFYTFQTMSYTIDIYRGKLEPTRSFPRFLLFVSFFPQLLAGPIERAGHLLPQIGKALERKRVDWAEQVKGLELIAWGLFKKTVFADHLGMLANQYYASPEAFGPWDAVMGTYAVALQFYFDFSAYSEIAKGTAHLFGLDLIWNFDQPFLARTPTDHWRRWHISLSFWFRDYVYVPLGGSRQGRYRAMLNLTAVMVISGLWHGAAWHFVVWGFYHGVLLIGGKEIGELGLVRRLHDGLGIAWKFFTWFLTFHAIVLGFVMFRVERFADIPIAYGHILEALTEAPSTANLWILGAVATFVACSYLDRTFGWMRSIRGNVPLSTAFHGILVAATLLLGSEGTEDFVYFQF